MIEVQIEGIDSLKRRLNPAKVERAGQMAINDTVRRIRPAASREIRAEWMVKASDLKRRITITRMARRGSLQGVVTAAGRPLPLTYFNPRAYSGRTVLTRTTGRRLARSSSRRGVFVRIKRRGGVTHLPSAFMSAVAAGRSGGFHVGVFRRKGKERLPIAEHRVVTIASMFRQRRVARVVEGTARRVVTDRFRHHLDRFLR